MRANSKLIPAPNAHKMIQRMAIDRKASFSKTALKARADSEDGTKKGFWVADVGDRAEEKLEYSSFCEEEGSSNTGSKDK